MATAKHTTDSEAKQVGRFGLVGILNTIVDFGLFNLIIWAFTLDKGQAVWAGVVSGTVAMINSYVFNARFTFRAKHITTSRVVAFFAITAFGVWVIRPLLLRLLTHTWLWPAHTVTSIAGSLHLPFSEQFLTNNFALGVTIILVLGYNYLMYKRFIFKR